MAIPKKNQQNKTIKPLSVLPSLEESTPSKQLIPLDDVVFTEVDVASVDQEEEDLAFIEAEEKILIPKREESLDSKLNREINEETPFFDDEDKMPPQQEEFIDREKKKIIPLGGKKAKIKDRDLDHRRNLLTGLKVFRLFVYLVILFILGLSIKNTFFPEQIYTNAEITAIAQGAIGETGFPTKRGEAYAKEYLHEYLTLTGSKVNKQLMNKLGTGNINGQHDSDMGRINATHGMRPIKEPILFDTKLATEYTALFKYNVYMSNLDGRDVNDEGLLTGHWLSFSVSVYYDKEHDALSIIEPPVLIPTYTIRKPNAMPTPAKLGNGEQDNAITSTLKPTINGFIKAFGNVDVNKHDEIVQYIPNNKPISLISGFGGIVKPRRGDSSISSVVYKSTVENEWKVDVKVEWASTLVPDEQAPAFTSHYVMTIKKTDENVYLVTKFAPYVFIAKEVE